MNIFKFKDKKSKNIEVFKSEVTKEILDEMAENNDKKIIYVDKPFYNLEEKLTNYTLCDYPNKILLYKGLLVKELENKLTDYFVICTDKINIDEIKQIYSMLKIQNFRKLHIKLNNKCEYEIIFNGKDINLDIKDYDLEETLKLYDSLKSQGYNIKNINLSFCIVTDENLLNGVNYYNYDYSKLDEINKNGTSIKIKYSSKCQNHIPYKNFRFMIDKITEYRNLVNNYGLSPLEKLMRAYDIMKEYKYKESDKIIDTYAPDKIVSEKNITCVGYSVMMNEILMGLENNIRVGNVEIISKHIEGKSEGHKRNIVRIDDDKYNIHGLYFLDVTWDSYDERFSQIYDDYHILDLYKHFLIPFSEYEKVFPKDSKPISIFSDNIMKKINDDWSKDHLNEILIGLGEDEKESLLNEYRITFFNDIEKIKDKFKYVCASRLPYETLLNVIARVRVAEGYKYEELKEELLRASKTFKEFYSDTTANIDEIIKQNLKVSHENENIDEDRGMKI